MAAGIVELVEHVGVDAPGAPLAVVRLRPLVRLESHVVWMDLRPDTVEQDPPLASNGRRTTTQERFSDRLHDSATDLRADLVATLRDAQ